MAGDGHVTLRCTLVKIFPRLSKVKVGLDLTGVIRAGSVPILHRSEFPEWFPNAAHVSTLASGHAETRCWLG